MRQIMMVIMLSVLKNLKDISTLYLNFISKIYNIPFTNNYLLFFRTFQFKL